MLEQKLFARCMRRVSMYPTYAQFLVPERQAVTATRLEKALEGQKPNQITYKY